MYDLIQHLHRQAAFSRATFGPGARTEGVLDHISKETEEVRTAKTSDARAKEWVDMVILSFDGLLREIAATMPHMTYAQVANYAAMMFKEKQEVNEKRDWPDWRTADPNKAIEHVRV